MQGGLIDNQDARPTIFLGGCGRSGTTLLRVILDSHPNIACGPEFKLIPSIANLWGHSVREFFPILEMYGLDKEDVNSAYRHFIEELMAKFKARSNKPRLAEKSPNNIFFFPQLARIFPDSPLIHVYRDGRDVVSSLLTMNWVSISTKKKFPYVESADAAADYWKKAIIAGQKASKDTEIGDRYYAVRYEDLVLAPEQTLRALCKFIDEPWHNELLEYHTVERDLAGESSASQVSQSLYPSSIGRWEQDLSDQDKEKVKEVAGDLLIELGYASDNDW